MTNSTLWESTFMKNIRVFLINNFAVLLIGALVLVGLYVISLYNYLFFHTLAEFSSILIAATIFVITWNARPYLDNGYLLFVGIGFLFVGGFAMLHMLSYAGMDIFTDSTDVPTQLWLCERLIQGLSMFLAPFFLRQKPTRTFVALVLGMFSALSLFLLASIFIWNIFPVTYISGVGLTPFKIYFEYFIIMLFLAGAVFLYLVRTAFAPDVAALLVASLIFNMIAEYIFTTYHSVTDIRNLGGHFFKIIAYYLIYRAIIVTGFVRPYSLLFRELSERERQLLQAQEREKTRTAQIEAIIDAVPAIVRIAHDSEGRSVTGNRAAYEFLGAEPGSNLSTLSDKGQGYLRYHAFVEGQELIPEEMPLHIAASSGQVLENFEETIVFEDGDERWLLGNVNPLFDERGHSTGAVAVLLDITSRVETEQKLAASELRYRSLFETMIEGLLLMDVICGPDGAVVDLRIMQVNPAYERIANRSRAEVIDHSIRDLSGDDAPKWIERYGKVALKGGSTRFEDYIERLDKTLEITAYQPEPGQVAVLMTDVSEQVRAREALRLSEAQLRRLVDSNIIGVIFTGEDGTVKVANDAFLSMLGFTRADFEAGRVNWVRLTPGEYLVKDMQGIAEATETGACNPYEKEFFNKDGARVPILIGYAYFYDQSPTYISFILDLTARKQAEANLEKYALQLERSNRELQDFAFVASHDLQEPLRKIQSFGERLQMHLGERIEPEERDYLERMLSASKRMRTMINDLLSLSRVTTRGLPFEEVNLNEIAAEVLSDLETRISASDGVVEVGDLPTIQADPIQMHQLLQNLISNALKFHKEDEKPVVKVFQELTERPKQVTIIVEDNGIGFEQEYAERIFQPFQRLHGLGRYEGSGIGLAICRRIVERHSGAIDVKSEIGKGARFKIQLPVNGEQKSN